MVEMEACLSPLSPLGSCIAIEETGALYTHLAHKSDNLKENSGEGHVVTVLSVIPHQTDGLADNQCM